MPVSQKILDIRAKRWIGSVDNLLSIPKTKAPTAPVANPTQPVNYTSPTTAIGTGVSYEKKAPTLATRDNPMIAVSTKPAPVDINTADMSTLLKEQDAINFKIANNSFTQDDYVRGREISRKLAEQMYKVPEAITNPYVSELEAKAQQLKSRDYTPELTARKQQLEANFNIRKNQLEENARRARESTIGNIAMAGGGRSSVAQQAELDIQRQLADQISAEQAAMQQEILAYQRQLEGASSDELSKIYDTINQLKAQSSQWQQQLQQQSLAKQQEAVSQFDTSLQQLAQNRGIKLDINDEKAVEQMVKIARNPDGTVNENFLKTLAPQYQELVKAWVLSGIGIAQPVAFTPKVERIGGTNKSPVYWYRDPNKQSFVTTNAQGVPTVRTGGVWMWWGTGGSTAWMQKVSSGSVYDDILSADPGSFKNIDQSKNYWFATNAILANEEIKNNQDYIKSLWKAEWMLYNNTPDVIKPDSIKRIDQAQRNFVNAVLRQESWAAIPESEMNNAIRQYFPQPWDSQELVKQKEQNRIVKANSLVESSWKSKVLRPILDKTTVKSAPQVNTPQTGVKKIQWVVWKVR